MGSPCAIILENVSNKSFHDLRHRISAELQRLEATYSHFRADSDLALATDFARRGVSRPLSDEFIWLLEQAREAFQNSQGRFDVTIGRLSRLWRSAQRLPTRDDLDDLRQQVGFEKVFWSQDGLRFALPNMDIEFGGIVKEYAVDRVTEICWGAGVGAGIVNFAGDVRVFGLQENGEPWRIGIKNPTGVEAVATLFVTDAGIATSGDYERFVEVNGQRYSHVIDARSGYPVHGHASITVVAETCMEAGIAATSALLAGADAEQWLIDRGHNYLIVKQGGEVVGPLISGDHPCLI